MSDFELLLSSYCPHIFILTGVGKQIRTLIPVPNYKWFCQEGSNSYGGVAILVHQKLQCSIEDKAENFILLRITLLNEKIYIGGVYSPPNCNPLLEIFDMHKDKKMYLFGDFNAKHSQWNCENSNVSGNKLNEWLNGNGFEVEIRTIGTLKAALCDRCSEYINIKKFRPPWPPHLVELVRLVNKLKRKFRRTRFLGDYQNFKYFENVYIQEKINHLFADDLTIIIKGGLEMRLSTNIKYLEAQAKAVLKALEEFSDNHILPVNVSKTKAMIVHSAVVVQKPIIKYKDINIEYVTFFKCLGVEIGTKLGMGIRLVYSLWGYEDFTTLALSREFSLRDYLYKYWLRFQKHLDEASEAII
ncbi:unnamed protein product [Rotaria sp. Silwood1]|nr:unnamed protein product [Rotaria sp. Silwood1]